VTKDLAVSEPRLSTDPARSAAAASADADPRCAATHTRFDTSRAGIPIGNNFNDKESLTADPTDTSGNLVYAVWDRVVSPNENAPATAFLNARAFHGPVWFARTTNGASANPTFEPARPIYDPGTQAQTISNQIVAVPDGTLVDGFFQIQVRKNAHDLRGSNVQVIRSTDKGVSWSKRAIQVAHVNPIGETDPEPINCRPFITGNSPCTLVRSDGVIVDLAVDYSGGPNAGRVYITWQDHDDNPFGDDLILLSHSDDGGLTWSAPVKVNQTPSDAFTDQAFEPTVHVNADGVVAVTYYDFRDDVEGDGELTTDSWIAHSHDGGRPGPRTRSRGPSTCTRRRTRAATSWATTRGWTPRATCSGRCSPWPAPEARGCSPTPTRPTSSSPAPAERRRRVRQQRGPSFRGGAQRGRAPGHAHPQTDTCPPPSAPSLRSRGSRWTKASNAARVCT
jgi:hypothetical protein